MQPKRSTHASQTQIRNPPIANSTVGVIHESPLRKTKTHFVYDSFASRFFGFHMTLAMNLCLVLLLLTACGNKSNQNASDPATTPSFILALGTNKLELTPGSSGSVPVTLQKSEGFTNAVTLTVAGSPEGLTSTFSSNPTEDSSELNVNITESVTPGTYTLFVQGLSGELRQSQALEVVVLPANINTITVTGKVVSDAGEPLARARVRIGSTVALINAEGAFKIEGVSTPYDLVIAVPQTGNQSEHAHIFQGLTRPDPTLPLFNINQTASSNATILGDLSGGAGFPNPENHVARAGFASTKGSRERFLSEEDGPDFSVNRVQFRGERTVGTLYALQYKDDVSVRGRIAQYTGYAEKTLELTNGAEFNNQDLLLEPVTTGFLSANITTPEEFPLDEVTVGVELGTTEFLPIRDFSPDSNVTYAVPEIGKHLSLQVTTNRVEGRKSELHKAGLLPNEVADLTLPVPPRLLEPADDTEGVDAQTRIAWENFESGISIVEFRFSSSQPDSRFLVYTKATETRFPDLGPEGLNPSANAFVSWHIQGFGPYASLDDFTAPDAACGIRCNGSGKSYVAGTSETLSFRLR